MSVSTPTFRLSSRHYADLKIPVGSVRQLAADAVRRLGEGAKEHTQEHTQEQRGRAARTPLSRGQILAVLAEVAGAPEQHFEHALLGRFAEALAEERAAEALRVVQFQERSEPAPFQRWGRDLDREPIQQMRNACRLPVAVRGAIMPDAHLGYGLPIGGVLATRGAVIPYAVGVDIACRMKLTVVDLPPNALDDPVPAERLRNAIERETRFGIGAKFKRRREHAVLDRDWSVTELTSRFKDRAWSQLGTSGSGNHFVEFGVFTVAEPYAGEFGVEAGDYLALLSHSGSRGVGAAVAGHYSKLARQLHPELPRELGHLSWLDLDSEPGQEYFAAMELMGHYAAANHACIHQAVHQHLGIEVLLDFENHHNFAWKENHDGEELVVHRKGATPAGAGVLGVIPGSMADPAYLVRGKGNAGSLESAAHGAGRVMSRTAAKKALRWKEARQYLTERKVTLMSAGLDEVPMVYKKIDQVMADQEDLVEVLAQFQPRLVKMAQGGRAED